LSPVKKPAKPDFIIFPPASDFENLLQPPDLSGIDPSNPIDDICGLFIALIEWAVKTIEAAGKLLGDLIKMLASPGSYPLRLGLYELAMMIWDIVNKTHEIMAHTGFFIPHSQQLYPGGELRLPNEIDLPLITLGGTVDATFRAALAAAFDPLGNLDQNQDVIGIGHSVADENYPYYPVLQYDLDKTWEGWEYRRPWAWPSVSEVQVQGAPDTTKNTPTETYNPFASFGEGFKGAYKPLRPGPYPEMTRPDVFFRTNAPVNEEIRSAYEKAQTPWQTDQLNERHLVGDRLKVSPLGDPIPFSAHLIGQLANDTGYSTQFNLDSDRAFAYLTWDWIRSDATDKGILNLPYFTPQEPPEGSDKWAQGTNPLLLKYKDKPGVPKPPPPPPLR
jgi:hypothetical protein